MYVTWRIMRNTHRIANTSTKFKVSYGHWTVARLSGNRLWYVVHETYHPTREAAIADADKHKQVYGRDNRGKDPGPKLNAMRCGGCGVVVHITDESIGRCGVGAVFFCNPCGQKVADLLTKPKDEGKGP